MILRMKNATRRVASGGVKGREERLESAADPILSHGGKGEISFLNLSWNHPEMLRQLLGEKVLFSY